MDPRTLAYYSAHASELAERYESVQSPVVRFFQLAFAPDSRVLDVGAGSGRDLAALLAVGLDGHGVEPSDELRQAALQRHPHLVKAGLFDAALALRRILKPAGRLLISLPSARTNVGVDERDANGRLFKAYAADELQLLFERLGFRRIGRRETEDALHRPGTRWYTLLFELQTGQGCARSIRSRAFSTAINRWHPRPVATS